MLEAELAKPPKYKHDCEHCKYLGQYYSMDLKNLCDLYSCNSIFGPTVVARTGDQPQDYLSGIYFKDRVDAVREAITRADRLNPNWQMLKIKA